MALDEVEKTIPDWAKDTMGFLKVPPVNDNSEPKPEENAEPDQPPPHPQEIQQQPQQQPHHQANAETEVIELLGSDDDESSDEAPAHIYHPPDGAVQPQAESEDSDASVEDENGFLDHRAIIEMERQDQVAVLNAAVDSIDKVHAAVAGIDVILNVPWCLRTVAEDLKSLLQRRQGDDATTKPRQ